MYFKTIKLSLLLIFLYGYISAQESGQKPFYEGTVSSMIHVPSIASRTVLEPSRTKPVQMFDGRASGNVIVPYKDIQTEDDFLAKNPHPLSQKISGKAPDLVFNAFASASQPTDPDLAVGPNHVFVTFNTGFIIYDKNGNALTAQLSPNPTIFPTGGCCDLTVSYDDAADRWVLSFLGSGAQIAVSDGPDPVNAGWNVYTISTINDYQKLSIWSDGYYLTDNTSSSNKVWALERSQMLLGNAAAKVVGFNLPGIVTSGFFSPQFFHVSSGNMPAAGNAPIVYLQDNAWGGVATDHIKLWLVNVNWTTTSSSTISAASQINLTPFISVFDGGSFANLTQPGGTAIDALQATIMNQAQFRKFNTYNSALFNFVVDTDASAGELAGIRWIELRQSGDGQPWSLYQEGTYTAPNGRHAWHGSLTMDLLGNIGMGYTSMSGPTTTTTTRVSSYYTGRYANDPLGTMTISEQLIANGNADIPNSERYGDYNKIDVDPTDNKTFYFINEYMSSGRKGVVGRFKIAPNSNNDLGVVSIDTPNTGTLTSNETISVTIFNYGQNAASNFPISYQIDGGAVVTETFSGSIASNANGNYTFTATGNFSTQGNTYVINSYTSLAGDEDNTNNGTNKSVTCLNSNDLGVTNIVSPVSGNNLGNQTVIVTIHNFGGVSQSNFNVSYTLNSGTPVVETVIGPLAPDADMNFAFSTLADLSAYTTHALSATTLHPNDAVPSNNSFSTTVVNSSCLSATNTTDYPIGPNAGIVTNSVINVTENQTINKTTVNVNLTHTYDSDIDMVLIAPNSTQVELSTDNGSYGDNYTNTTFDDASTTSIIAGTAPFTGSFKPEGLLSTFNSLSTLGNWTLKITDDTNVDGGNLLDWTITFCYTGTAGIEDESIYANDLIVAETSEDQFDISWKSDTYKEQLIFTAYEMTGKKIAYYKLKNVDGKYSYHLDMSYAPTGVYIVKVSNGDFAKVKKIIVK